MASRKQRSVVSGRPGGASAPFEAVANTSSTLFSDDFQTATGWAVGDPSSPDTATSGAWTRVDPNGYQSQSEYDHTPLAGTLCYVTGNATRGQGSQYVTDGKTTLRSPVLDLSAAPTAQISFWLWFNNDRQFALDPFNIDITANAGASPTWTSLLVIPADGPPDQTAGPTRRRLGDLEARQHLTVPYQPTHGSRSS